jgi:hypothetical protein
MVIRLFALLGSLSWLPDSSVPAAVLFQSRQPAGRSWKGLCHSPSTVPNSRVKEQYNNFHNILSLFICSSTTASRRPVEIWARIPWQPHALFCCTRELKSSISCKVPTTPPLSGQSAATQSEITQHSGCWHARWSLGLSVKLLVAPIRRM